MKKKLPLWKRISEFEFEKKLEIEIGNNNLKTNLRSQKRSFDSRNRAWILEMKDIFN